MNIVSTCSTSKRLKTQQANWGFFRRHTKAFIITVTALLVLTATVRVFWPRLLHPYLLILAMRDQKLANDRFKQVTGVLYADKELPLRIREWLLRIARDNSKGNLGLEIEGFANPKFIHAIMAADPTGPKLRIVVYAPPFLQLSRTQAPDLFESTILAALLHEDVHNERWPLKKDETAEEVLDEEVRAYGKTCLLVIRPLREAGLVYPPEFTRLDDMLRNKCWDDPKCPEFHEAVRLYLKRSPVPAAGIK